MCSWKHNQAGYLTERFVRGTRALAVDAPGVRGQVGLFPFGLGFHGSIAYFPFICFLLVVA
jgi:hypothetical protein